MLKSQAAGSDGWSEMLSTPRSRGQGSNRRSSSTSSNVCSALLLMCRFSANIQATSAFVDTAHAFLNIQQLVQFCTSHNAGAHFAHRILKSRLGWEGNGADPERALGLNIPNHTQNLDEAHTSSTLTDKLVIKKVSSITRLYSTINDINEVRYIEI